MLGKLFGSRARVKILKLFLLNPDKRYYIRGIARDLKLQPNSVSRELDNLEKFGLLTSKPEPLGERTDADTKKGTSGPDKKFYRVNTGFVLYEEIKQLFIKAQVLYERDFINKLKRAGHLKLLILTGFFANKENSPVDILMVGRIRRHRALKVIKEIETELGRELNYTIMDPKEFKYRRDITDVFLYGILEGKKIVPIDELEAA